MGVAAQAPDKHPAPSGGQAGWDTHQSDSPCVLTSWSRGPVAGGGFHPASQRADRAPGPRPTCTSQPWHAFGSAQTRTYLSPDEVLKGLHGEIEEVLNGVSLSVSVLKELYRTYDFCCANMRLFFKVRPGLQAGVRGEAGSGVGEWASPPRCSVWGHLRQTRPFLPQKDREPVLWEFPSSFALARMNSFFCRVQTIEVKVNSGAPSPPRRRLL